MPTISGINSTMQRYENKYRFFNEVILFIVKYKSAKRPIKNIETGKNKYFSAFLVISGIDIVLYVSTINTIRKKILEA